MPTISVQFLAWNVSGAFHKEEVIHQIDLDFHRATDCHIISCAPNAL